MYFYEYLNTNTFKVLHIRELKYHIVWCTKYRRKVLVPKVKECLIELIKERCESNNYKLIEVEIMPDYVHIFLDASNRDSVHRIVSQLKGYSSHSLRKEFKFLTTRLPNLWTRSYYTGTIGHVSHETVKRYIQNQTKK